MAKINIYVSERDKELLERLKIKLSQEHKSISRFLIEAAERRCGNAEVRSDVVRSHEPSGRGDYCREPAAVSGADGGMGCGHFE